MKNIIMKNFAPRADIQDKSSEAVEELCQLLEHWLYIPCCHVTGMHDPQHFEEGRGVCEIQKADAFVRFCKDLSVNPVVRSKPNCGWCNDYPDMRRGEGVRLFKEEKKEG
jgi:hypothetical protein